MVSDQSSKNIRIGMICRYDNSGLGSLSWEFARHLKPEKILLVENYKHDTFPERYEKFNTKTVDTFIDSDLRKWILSDIDVLFTAETFYDWSLIRDCRAKGIKTALYTMYEMTPDPIPMFPDLLLCPSKLDYDVFKDFSTRVEYIPVPMATDRLKWKKRTKANRFIHTASHGGLSGRKGTQLLINAMQYVVSDIDLTIYTWEDRYRASDPRIKIEKKNFTNYWEAWETGDVLVYPQDYNGICLPVAEALTSGLAVISTDIYPFNEYLPKELLFKPTSMYTTRAAPRLIETEAAHIDPRAIALKIDRIAGKDISEYSEYGKKWGEENSWDKLLAPHLKLLKHLCK